MPTGLRVFIVVGTMLVSFGGLVLWFSLAGLVFGPWFAGAGFLLSGVIAGLMGIWAMAGTKRPAGYR